jgi:hypothetical protein
MWHLIFFLGKSPNSYRRTSLWIFDLTISPVAESSAASSIKTAHFYALTIFLSTSLIPSFPLLLLLLLPLPLFLLLPLLRLRRFFAPFLKALRSLCGLSCRPNFWGIQSKLFRSKPIFCTLLISSDPTRARIQLRKILVTSFVLMLRTTGLGL